MIEESGMPFWIGWSGRASLTRCLLSRSLNGMKEGNVHVWEKNVSALHSCVGKGPKAGACLAGWRTCKEAVWLEQSGRWAEGSLARSER